MAGRSRSTGPTPSAVSGSRPRKRPEATAAPTVYGPIREVDPPALDNAATPKTPRRIALDAAFRDQDDLRQSLTEHLRQERIRSDRLNERVQRAFQDFTPAVRAPGAPVRRHQVEPGAAPFETMSQIMSDQFRSLKAVAPAPRIAIHPQNSLIEWDQDGDDADGFRLGAIELSKLITFIDSRGVAALTLANTSAVTACQAERQAQALLDAIETVTPAAPADAPTAAPAAAPYDAPGDASGDSAAGSKKAAAFVDKAITAQMAPATAPEERLTYGLIPNGADQDASQARLLETFQLRPGPTDVTAYHDFSTLQIAFEHVWMRIFDGELESLGRQLYREYVGLKDFLGYDPATADRPISSLDDLTWLIGEIRSLSQIAQDALPPGKEGVAVGTANIPQGTNEIAQGATEFVESLPGGRVGTALGTLGISELVLWFLNEAANFGKKTALRWDDLVNGRPLQRGDRIIGWVDQFATNPGFFELVLKTDISKKKEVAFEIFSEASQKFGNVEKVANASGNILVDRNGQAEFFEDRNRVPLATALLPSGLLEFSSEEEGYLAGRYVLGDLDKIVPDGGRLTLYWKDR